MIVKINCKFNDNAAWCTNKNIKRSLFGIGARCCKEFEGKKCEFKQSKTISTDVPIKDTNKYFNDNYTWEYNLMQNVRWDNENAENDVCFYVKNWLEKIAEQEGYTLIKNK